MLSSRKRWIVALAALGLLIPAVWGLVELGESIRAERAISSFHGARLGMTPSALRDSFEVAGEWSAESTEEGEYVLTFLPTESVDLRSARFEFHLGLLVAVRAELSEPGTSASGELLEASPIAVRHRVVRDESVKLSLFARDCPTHAAEVRELLGSR